MQEKGRVESMEEKGNDKVQVNKAEKYAIWSNNWKYAKIECVM